jgi:hypothetical protein
MEAKIDAHTRRDLADHLRNLAFEIERAEWHSSVSGGCSSGHVIQLRIDDEQTPERFRAQLEAWCANERSKAHD